MTTCMFCLEEKGDLTGEHVFPAALGGVLVVGNSVCVECNNGFSQFEQPLARELAPVRFLLKIKDRRGNIPEVAATAKTPTREHEARLKEDGTLRMKPIVTEVARTDGKREFLHQYPTDKQREQLRREEAEKGHEFVEIPPGEPEEAEIHFGGDLEVIGAPDGLRAAAKIAYVGLARQVGTQIAMGESFARVRDYIRAGNGTPCSRLFVNRGYMQAVQQGPHQHSLTLSGRHDTKRVDGIVRLFSHLCYFVELSSSYFGADFCHTLVYDAYRGRVDGILLAHPIAEMLQIEDVAKSPQPLWDNRAETGIEFCRFLDDQMRKYMERKRKEVGKG